MEQQMLENRYLNQVLQQKAQVEQALRRKCNAIAAEPQVRDGGVTILPAGPRPSTVDVRISGWWRFRSVVVPPNAYVVHTRRGHAQPLHCGLGVSFRFDPTRDAFLVVPSAMQTIILQANCITRERQGVVVQGYVQWIIEDFATAYRKLDFTDPEDPMAVVNVQLREQAEATIKDAVATMSIEDVLNDKQPIIKELTNRLRHVAEGEGQDKGLGLRIVTVQIKEAVVSSARVWEMLQRPFRAERAKEARLAELTSEAVVRAREEQEKKAAAALGIETEAEIARIEAAREAEAFERVQSEKVRRARIEAETLNATMEHEREKQEKLAALARSRVEAEILEHGIRQEAANRQTEKEIAFMAARRKIDNDLTGTAVQMKMIDALPAIAEKMPKPNELKSVSIGGADGVTSLVSSLLKLAEAFKNGKSQ